MIKTGSKFLLLITSTLLGVILLSMISSFILFKNVSRLQVKHDKVEKIIFLRQYEYELMRTAMAFTEAYSPDKTDQGSQEFDNWFNVLWSRSQSIDTGIIGANVKNSGFDYKKLEQSIILIDKTLYQSENLGREQIEDVRHKFTALITNSHLFHQQRDSIYQEVELEKQQTIFVYYRNSLILSSVTLLFGLIISLFLYRNNKHLLEMREQLEYRVQERTIELKDKNIELKQEVKERYAVEEQLVTSQATIESAKESAIQQLNYDPLTNLASRRLFTDRFDLSLNAAKRNHSKIAVLFLDLDRFKHVNDTLGHSAGDKLLRKAALRINNSLRQADTAARFGGDEFAVLLPDIENIHQVQHVAERILKELRSPFKLLANQIHISASIGIALYPDDGTTAEPLLRKADNAMYKAKEKGKNTYQFFTQQMEIEASNRSLMESALHNAVKNHEFTLVFQPIINQRSGRAEAAETLIRWSDKKSNPISPDQFIPVAEEVGLITKMGEWVLHEACIQAVKWHKEHDLTLKISVNVSCRQFRNNDFASTVKKALVDSQLAANKLTLEITESLLMVDDDNHIMEQLMAIRALGVHLAIDDFGTGYSSLSYLKRFPIDVLKIDRSFIQDLLVNKSDAELVKGILSLAKSLQLTVVAEGVEEIAQVEFLAAYHCAYFQGYYFSKPLSSDDLVTFFTLNQTNKYIVDDLNQV